jgi:transposase
MSYYVGIDTSLETVNLCVVDHDGAVCREQKVLAEPEAIAAALASFGQALRCVGIEAGPTSAWLVTELRAVGLPVICAECRHLKVSLGAMRNKTDRNDARGIAQTMRLGWFRAVHVKSEQAQEARMLLIHRSTMLARLMAIENTIRRTLKVFGLRLGHVSKLTFEPARASSWSSNHG